MTVLLLGGGGREHAMGWSLARSGARVVSMPGNPGLASIGPTTGGSPADPLDVRDAVAAVGADYVLIGPEAPLAAGVADALRTAGVPVVGPGRSAARLESSKAFAKKVMESAGVATGGSAVFDRPGTAREHLAALPGPFVVKADGLAAGKGVLVSDDRSEAGSWIDRCFDGEFGRAGDHVVIEEFLEGPEVSVFALCDGLTAIPFGHARDHKRLADGDMGPNTGGMGCYSPIPDAPGGLIDDTMSQVVAPILQTMADWGTPFSGFLYTGLVLTADGPKVLEFNVRMGDPETQVVLPLLETPFHELMGRAASGDLSGADAVFSGEFAVDVVLAAHGYPASPRTGDPIAGLDRVVGIAGAAVFHAGTAREGDDVITVGGRVVNVVGTGPTLADARSKAYEAAAVIDFAGKQMRTDIGGVTK